MSADFIASKSCIAKQIIQQPLAAVRILALNFKHASETAMGLSENRVPAHPTVCHLPKARSSWPARWERELRLIWGRKNQPGGIEPQTMHI